MVEAAPVAEEDSKFALGVENAEPAPRLDPVMPVVVPVMAVESSSVVGGCEDEYIAIGVEDAVSGPPLECAFDTGVAESERKKGFTLEPPVC